MYDTNTVCVVYIYIDKYLRCTVKYRERVNKSFRTCRSQRRTRRKFSVDD